MRTTDGRPYNARHPDKLKFEINSKYIMPLRLFVRYVIPTSIRSFWGAGVFFQKYPCKYLPDKLKFEPLNKKTGEAMLRRFSFFN